jgi:hypothetical protein
MTMLSKIADVILRRRWLYRSSVTGRFVSKEFADRFPETTYRVRW